jgi:Photosynthetic reaction centre cytochrome C subunit
MSVSRSSQAAVLATASAILFLIAGRAMVFAAQDPVPTSPAQPAPAHHHEHPAPTNLKVLPRNLTGEQVHEIMEQWEGELGTTCKTCHTVDRTKKSPDGKLAFNYADDSKEEKRTARLMFKMVDEINTNYVAKIDSSGAPVTCGTCHRGHLGPEAFVPVTPHPHDHVD